jgi:hypothetical protein
LLAAAKNRSGTKNEDDDDKCCIDNNNRKLNRMVAQRTLTLSVLATLLSTAAAFPLHAFSATSSGSNTHARLAVALQAEGTGGWGLGNSREMVPEEFAKGGERRAFEGYNLRDRGEFMRKVRSDADDMKSSELDELLGVAKIAGLKVKDPSERLNKFDSDVFEDDEDLDLSV